MQTLAFYRTLKLFQPEIQIFFCFCLFDRRATYKQIEHDSCHECGCVLLFVSFTRVKRSLPVRMVRAVVEKVNRKARARRPSSIFSPSLCVYPFRRFKCVLIYDLVDQTEYGPTPRTTNRGAPEYRIEFCSLSLFKF